MSPDPEDRQLRSVALRNASAIQLARQRAEEDLLRTKEALEARTEELARSLSVTRATLESTADGILVTDHTGRIETFNQKFLEVWGLAQGELEGEDHRRLLQRLPHIFRDPPAHLARLEAIYGSTTESLDQLELADGRCFERFSRPQVIEGRTVGRVWSFRDVTTRRRAEAQLLDEAARERAARAEVDRVSRLKDEFLATLSHELRTPLSAILGWSRALLLKPADPASLERGLQAIARNALAQARLIDDLLDMSGIVSGKVRLEVQPIDLTSVIEAAIEVVRPSVDAKGIRLHQVLDPLAGMVSGDPNRLQQVVWNLLANAVKFTPREGRIEVLLRRVNSHAELIVRDSGIGIEAQFLPQVFDRFRQADSSTTRSHGGLGLGLSIARQLVVLHGGSIQAASEGLGLGATFVVCLPLTVLPAQPDRAHPTTAATSDPAAGPGVALDLHGVSILIVDDEPDSRELVEQVLSACGAAVHSAGSAHEALALFETVRPDLLLSDIGMPDRDGYQFMQEVRKLAPERGGKTPAIALTAFARSEDRTRAMVAGYQVHLAKPVEPRELLATVGSLVGRFAAL